MSHLKKLMFITLLIRFEWDLGGADCALLWGVTVGRWVTDPHVGPVLPHPYPVGNLGGAVAVGQGSCNPLWVRGD